MLLKEKTKHKPKLEEDGFLHDLREWDEDVAAWFARDEGIDPLTPRHFDIIRHLRDHHGDGILISRRVLVRRKVTTINELFQLFPDRPMVKAYRIAGLPKPNVFLACL